MTTTIRLGKLTLVGEERESGAIVNVKSGDHGLYNLYLHADEWKGLIHVSAVVEAAREWDRSDKAMQHSDDPTKGKKFLLACDVLNSAISTLDAGTEGE